jgi:hypothetical protein
LGGNVLANIRRRTLLHAACAAVVSSCIADSGSASASSREQSLLIALRDLETLLRWPEKTKTLAARYRANTAEPNHLLSQLRASGSAFTSSVVAEQFSRIRAGDFKHGRIVILDGWVLARAEAELCELLYDREAQR